MTTAVPASEATLRTDVGPARRPAADRFMRRLLRISPAQPRLDETELRSAFSRSIVVSAIRCTLTYLVLPFLAPVLGVAAGVGPWIGIPLGAVAIVFNVKSIRRFWRADHRWRWAYTAIGTTVIVLLLVLVVGDLVELLT
ncbi:hypothetical protein PO878_09570 [Iamia majanohamensis]|uniref:Uncharacterized protein n=1 Tax=Iamia majanohamensis TaxID=467976 RepID=A0AAE9YI71_9ACTN|nr:hypothetical protein [Iamia majanohamensis]WCO68972.1 hypothetical protein PO878_09570 [Iamia majanohamensis]